MDRSQWSRARLEYITPNQVNELTNVAKLPIDERWATDIDNTLTLSDQTTKNLVGEEIYDNSADANRNTSIIRPTMPGINNTLIPAPRQSIVKQLVVNFNRNSSQIPDINAALRNLQPIIDVLRTHSNLSIKIAGRTAFDASDKIAVDGRQSNGKELAEDRAKAVSKLLIEEGGVNSIQVTLDKGSYHSQVDAQGTITNNATH